MQLQAIVEEAAAQAKRKAEEEAALAEQHRRAELEAAEAAKRLEEAAELQKAEFLRSIAKRMKKEKAKRAREEAKKGKAQNLIAEREARKLVKLVEEAQRALMQNKVEEVAKPTKKSKPKRPKCENEEKPPIVEAKSAEVVDDEESRKAELRRVLAKRIKKEKEKLVKNSGDEVLRELLEPKDNRPSVSFEIYMKFYVLEILFCCICYYNNLFLKKILLKNGQNPTLLILLCVVFH